MLKNQSPKLKIKDLAGIETIPMEDEEPEKLPRRRRAGAFHIESNYENPVDVSS